MENAKGRVNIFKTICKKAGFNHGAPNDPINLIPNYGLYFPPWKNIHDHTELLSVEHLY